MYILALNYFCGGATDKAKIELEELLKEKADELSMASNKVQNIFPQAINVALIYR